METISQSVSARLRSETKAEHAALEKAMMPMLRASVNTTAYGKLLQKMHAFLAPVEEQVLSTVGSVNLPDLPERRSAKNILSDLEELGIARPPASRPVIPPALDDLPRAWGALYVLEGSTLGGQVVRNIIIKQFPDAVAATTYFNSYGEATGQYWNRFREALENWAVQTPEASDDIVAGARDTFIYFKNWLESNSETE